MDDIHLGSIISRKLNEKKVSNSQLAKALGVTYSAVTYILRKNTMDVYMLHRVSNALKYNFFRHFPVNEDEGEKTMEGVSKVFDVRDKTIDELKTKLAECEKITEPLKRDLAMQKQENVYLKKINELLEKK